MDGRRQPPAPPPPEGWAPFSVCPPGVRAPGPRGLESPAGVGDRLRTAAFAEMQAREAFRWAARRYEDAPPGLGAAWEALARAEDRHLGWLLGRLRELGQDAGGRAVSAALWDSLLGCPTARDFALFIAAAEERGRLAGERFRAALEGFDPESARIFGLIAEEEKGHVDLARRHYGGGG